MMARAFGHRAVEQGGRDRDVHGGPEPLDNAVRHLDDGFLATSRQLLLLGDRVRDLVATIFQVGEQPEVLTLETSTTRFVRPAS